MLCQEGFHESHSRDVRYRSLPLLTEMADGFDAPRYGLRPTAGPHRCLAASHGHVSLLRQRASANSKHCQRGFPRTTRGLTNPINSARGVLCFAFHSQSMTDLRLRGYSDQTANNQPSPASGAN